MSKGRILSGMRPTGKLHMGHLSVLENWVRLQDEYNCYFMVADWHALTSEYENVGSIKDNIREMVMDWLSVGINPEKSVIFVQSHVKEHAELHLLFSMFTPLSWLERVPTYKDQIVNLGKQGKDVSTYGFLGYPLLQAADILVYKANAVPVGEDQLPHIEFTREVARRFNYLYKTDLFPEPQGLLAEVKLLPGLDGRKMSKSYKNEIAITASEEEVAKKVKMMVTDPGRIRKDDPGNPDICTVHNYNNIYNIDEVKEIARTCKAGQIGCVDCKKRLAEKLNKALAPYRERRVQYEKNPKLVEEILVEGARKAGEYASKVMKEVRKVMNLR